jgi:TonB-linked SusC/RagA family outer membrane protein
MRKVLLLGLLWLSGVGFVVAQDRRVTGKVTATDDNSPLPGVSVLLKGSQRGTSTDANGNYSLAVPASGGTLVFSAVGFATQNVDVSSQSVVDVKLVTDARMLTEVVVTGTGVETSKAKLGMAVESISGKSLPQTPTASIDQALVGKIAGAQISSISGNPGDPVNIVLRGINTVQGSTRPLIMVDGVQVAATDINSLDLTNVDRVEVVQGAASSALYGAQGANGVIQIFTKRGKQGRPQINFSSSYAVNEFLNVGNVGKASLHPYLTDAVGNLVDSKGNILKLNDLGGLTGLSYQYGGGTRYAIQDIRNVANKPYVGNFQYYDQFKQVFQQGSTANNAINISGASGKSDFNIALANNHTVSPILKNGYVDRTNLSANIGTELAKGLTLRSVTQLIYTKNTLIPGLGAAGGIGYGLGNRQGALRSNLGASPYGFLNTSPFFDLTYKLPDGNSPFWQRAGFVSINAANPFYQQQYTTGLDNKVEIVQSFDLNYKVNKFLDLNARYGINYRTENARWTFYNQSQNTTSNAFNVWSSYQGTDNTGEIDNFQYTNTNQNLLASASIRTDFQKDFGWNLPIQTSTLALFDYRNQQYREYDSYGAGLGLSPPFNILAANTKNVIFDYTQPFITYGYLIDQKIDVGDYGGITAGFRSDWSSAFGKGSTPFTFPHFNGYINPLSFFRNGSASNVLPYFKLRAAYGKAGIQPGAFDRFPILDNVSLGSFQTYSIQQSSNNANLNVEVSTETEVGTDFGINLGNGRSWFRTINGALTYWTRSTDNAIYVVSVPPSTGSTGLLTNAIGMSSKGFQFSLNFPVYNSRNLKWDFTTNFGHQLSMINSIAGGADIILTTAAGSTALVLTPGQPIGQVYGYKALTSLDFTRQDGTRYIKPGDEGNYSIVDGRVVNNKTYQIQFTDETYPLMNPNPKFNMSFINGVTYKDWLTLNFQFDWVYGSKLYNQTKEWMYRDGIHADYTKPVTINGNTGAYTAYWSSAYYALWGSLRGAGNNATKDFFVEDASFVRLRNISLGIDLAKLVKIPVLNRAQLVFTGRNLLTFTKYTGMDPEISSGAANSAFDRGVDHSTLPNIRSYQIGLNIGL